MTLEAVSGLLQETMSVALLVASPFLAAALVVGLVISIFQAATQVNEQTLTFVPKIAIVLGTFAVLFPWIMRTIIDFGTAVILQSAQRGGS